MCKDRRNILYILAKSLKLYWNSLHINNFLYLSILRQILTPADFDIHPWLFVEVSFWVMMIEGLLVTIIKFGTM